MGCYEMFLKKEYYELIKSKYAGNLLKSIKNYNVCLEIEKALQLVDYEDSLNNILNSNEIDLQRSGNIVRTLTNDEINKIKDTVTIEIENLELIKAYLNRKGVAND